MIFWAASPCFCQALPASSPVPPAPVDVDTCNSVTVSETSFPLFSMTASFTWGTEKLWQLLNVELQEILLLGLQNLTLSRVQILQSETNFHFGDQFKWSYFKSMYTLLTRTCPPEQEEFVFLKNQIRLIRFSFRLSSMRFLSPDWLANFFH